MGLFNLFFGGGYSYHRNNNSTQEEYRRALREIRKLKSRLYRLIRTAVILAAVLATALLVMSTFVKDLQHAWLFKLVFAIYALCAGGGMALPWITQYERDKRRAAKGAFVAPWRTWVIYAFWGFIAICTLLWIISVFVISDDAADLLTKGNGDFNESFVMLRVSIIFTLQLTVGSIIATSTLRHGMNYIGLRLVIYVTILYLDFWLSWFVGGITVPKLVGEVYFAPIRATGLWVIAVLAAVMLLAAGAIFGNQTRRNEIELFLKGDIEALTGGDVDPD